MIEVESSHRKEENSPVKYVNGGLQSLYMQFYIL